MVLLLLHASDIYTVFQYFSLATMNYVDAISIDFTLLKILARYYIIM